MHERVKPHSSALRAGTPTLRRRLLSGGAWAFAGRVVQVLTALVSNALLARLLSPQDLGAYFLAFSVAMLAAMVGSLGTNFAAVRFVAERIGMNQAGRARQAVNAVCLIGVTGALGFGLLYIFLGDTLANKLFHAPALAAVTGLVGAWVVVMAVQSLLAETLRGFQDIRSATAFGGLVAGVLLTASLGLLWAMEGRTDLVVVMLLAVGSTLASVLLASWLLQRKVSLLPRGGSAAGAGLLEILLASWPLFVTQCTLYVLTQADLWILGAFRPQAEVAIYGAAARTVLLVGVPLLVVNAVLPPVISEMYAQGKVRRLEQVLRATATLAGIPAFLVLSALISFGGPILGMVYGDYYRAGATVLALLSAGQLANVCAGSCGLTLMMSGHQATMMKISAFVGVVVVCGAAWAVRDHGMVGVASVAAGGMVLQNALMLLFVKKRTGLWTHVGFRLSQLREIAAR